MRNKRTVYGCPVELTLDVLGGKWKAILLAHLKDEPLSYGDLRRRVDSLSDKVLTQRLKDLEEAGLVQQQALDGDSRRFKYALTARGESLRPVLQSMFDWGSAASHEMEVVIRHGG